MQDDDDDDDDDNDDPMILNNRAKNHTSERTIVPWTVIFVLKIPQKNMIKFAVENFFDFFCISYANICGNIFARINIRNYLRKIFEKFIFLLIFA